jgi:hypothetical protein
VALKLFSFKPNEDQEMSSNQVTIFIVALVVIVLCALALAVFNKKSPSNSNHSQFLNYSEIFGTKENANQSTTNLNLQNDNQDSSLNIQNITNTSVPVPNIQP